MHKLITGGAGFIGSHLVDYLLTKNHNVIVLDNRPDHVKNNLTHVLTHPNLQIFYGDCTCFTDVENAIQDVDVVFHLAANPDVRSTLHNPELCYRHNVNSTFTLLEAFRRSSATTIVFTSTSAVYGDPKTIPTSEDHPTQPISLYAASKVASEAFISAYAHSFDKQGIILRLANVVGARSTHGVIYDFIRKLQTDPTQLEILGDGTQIKSYFHIDDCIDAINVALETTKTPVSILNVGSNDHITVTELANIIVREMQLENVELRYTGGVDGGRGWTGDVKCMLLDTQQLKKFGWTCRFNSKESVRRTVHTVIQN
jgi:UDP-glucose 4-epimerase